MLIPKEIKSHDNGYLFYQYYYDCADEDEKKCINDWEKIFERIKDYDTRWCTILFQFHQKFILLRNKISEKKYKIYLNLSQVLKLNDI